MPLASGFFFFQNFILSSSRFSSTPALLFASNYSTVFVKPHRALRSSVTSAVGILICAWSAALMSFIFHNRGGMVAVPLAFLVIVFLVSVRCGVASGILGCIAAALIFAMFLYPPLGSPQVASKDSRSNLGWLVLGGFTISYLLGSSAGGRQRPS
jgi:integral membrane sensor domain MASE1